VNLQVTERVLGVVKLPLLARLCHGASHRIAIENRRGRESDGPF